MPQTFEEIEYFTREEMEAAVQGAVQLAEAGAARRVQGLVALTGAGLAPAAADALLELPALAGHDFSTPEGTQQALSTLASTFPALFAPAAPPVATPSSLAPLGGVGGSPRPAPAASDLASMNMEDYIAHRAQQKG